jgi:hypothetical protein
MAKQDNTLYWLLGGAAALYLLTSNSNAAGAAIGAAKSDRQDFRTLNLKPNEYRAILWKDDIDGISNRVIGDTVVFFYAADPTYWQQRILLKDVLEIAMNTTEKLN